MRVEVGMAVRVRPGDELHRWMRSMGHSDTGRVVGMDPSWGPRVRVEWDGDHHRETIAVEHLEPV